MKKHAIICILGLALARLCSAGVLPPEALDQLERQKAALALIYVKYDQALSVNNRVIISTNIIYFETNHFIITENNHDPGFNREVAFDGTEMWSGNVQRRTLNPNFILKKTSLTNEAELTDLYWQLPYFETAGIDIPAYPSDLREFVWLEPIALKVLANDKTAEVVPEGENFRLTGYIDDPVLVNARKIDLALYRTRLTGKSMTPEAIAREIGRVKELQDRTPRRKISLLLDAKHGYAATEREDWSADGQQIARYQAGQWLYFSNSAIWLPSQCTISYFSNPATLDTFSQDPVRKIVCNLEEARFAKQDAEFNLSKAPKYKVGGTWVYDDAITQPSTNGLPTPVILTLSADGRLLQHNAGLVKPTIKVSLLWKLIVLLTVAAPPVLFFMFRTKSSK